MKLFLIQKSEFDGDDIYVIKANTLEEAEQKAKIDPFDQLYTGCEIEFDENEVSQKF
jgi:hypothetical protein